MDVRSLLYALIQALHNLGAATVLGGAFFAWWQVRSASSGAQRRMAWAVLLAWGVQAGSGASFGAVTFFYDHEFPDLHTTALVALIIKVSCAAAGFMLAAWYLKRERDYDVNMRRRVWGVLTLLAALALSSAAFLRWFA